MAGCHPPPAACNVSEERLARRLAELLEDAAEERAELEAEAEAEGAHGGEGSADDAGADLIAAAAAAAARSCPPCPSCPSCPTPGPAAAGGARREAPAERVHVPVGSSPARGPAGALVTLIIFGDYQCPFCAREMSVLEELRARHARELRVVFKHYPLPFHTGARPAAEAAMEAGAQRGDEGFWAMHDRLYTNIRDLEIEALYRHAAALGLDGERFAVALSRHVHVPAIEADVALGGRVGVRGTPAMFVNGRRVNGAVPLEQLAEIIDQELAAARRALRRGVPRARIYETMARRGGAGPGEDP